MDAGESHDEQFECEEDEAENIGRLVREAVLFILPEREILVGGWALIEGSNNTDQIDSVLVLTKLVFEILIRFFSKHSYFIILFLERL